MSTPDPEDWGRINLPDDDEVVELRRRLAAAEAEAIRAHNEVSTLKRETQKLLDSLKDPAAVRVNILRGEIGIPEDLVWLHDSNGTVSQLLGVMKNGNNTIRELQGELDLAKARAAAAGSLLLDVQQDSVKYARALRDIVGLSRLAHGPIDSDAAKLYADIAARMWKFAEIALED